MARTEKQKEQDRAKRLYKTYGLSLAAWKELVKNGCWMCGKKDGRVCVDHLHQPGYKKMVPEDKVKYVRGSLCFLCNTMIGKLEKRKNARFLLERVVAYFALFPIKGDL